MQRRTGDGGGQFDATQHCAEPCLYRACFPTIYNVELLLAELQFLSLGEEKLCQFLTDTSPRTAVEAGDWHFPVVKAKRKVSRLSTVVELTAIFY